MIWYGLIMKTTRSLTLVLLGLCVLICAGIFWPKLDTQPKSLSKEFKPMTAVQTANRVRISKEKKEPVKVEFGLKASFDPKPETPNQTNQ